MYRIVYLTLARTSLYAFTADNQLTGDLPETLASLELLSKVHLEGNGIDFASNINDVFCGTSGKGDTMSGFQDLTIGASDCSSCLCCTDCPDGPGK